MNQKRINEIESLRAVIRSLMIDINALEQEMARKQTQIDAFKNAIFELCYEEERKIKN